jgi:hypothetical protein
MSSCSKTFTALSHLQDYADASDKAHEELKSCMWQLTKSRRNVRSGIIGVDSTTAYTAELLREELRAQIRVVDNGNDTNTDNNNGGEIDLVDEDSGQQPAPSNDKEDAAAVVPEWKVYNVLSEIDNARKSASQDASSSAFKSRAADSTESTGMRQRKNNNNNNTKKAATTIPTTSSSSSSSLDTSPTSSWTMVQEEDLNSDLDEDEKIMRTDPIKLFGGYFTARELKVAQLHAKESLNSYIQAANQAAQLLELLKGENNNNNNNNN